MKQIIHTFVPEADSAVWTPVGQGNINDTYRVDVVLGGEQKVILLQRLNHLVFKDPAQVMDNTSRICAYLTAQPDYPLQVPSPILAKDGSNLVRDDQGNYWRAFPFIERSYTPDGLVTPDIARKAARAYGAFARALRDFPAATLAETIPGFHDTDMRWLAFLEVIRQDPVSRVGGVQKEIDALFAAKPLFDLISRLKRSGELPLRVSHNDTKAGNVLFSMDTHEPLAVIDLDTVMPGTLLSDFGDMVRTFVPSLTENSVDEPHLRLDVLLALREGFLSETGDFITTSEQQHLLTGGAWIIGEQALRFLTDWIAGDVYYKIGYPEHNLVRARNQLQLLAMVNREL
ncbi:MAG TPA: mucin desulfatase [Saprospirales bacterium]|nr:mucin desulfatase [Saprospirales bacterium]